MTGTGRDVSNDVYAVVTRFIDKLLGIHADPRHFKCDGLDEGQKQLLGEAVVRLDQLTDELARGDMDYEDDHDDD